MEKEYKHAEIIGPFTEPEWSYAVVNKCIVPHIKLVRLHGQNDGKTEIHMDKNAWIIDDSDIDVVLHMLATCMARAAGYNCHGENSQLHNPYKVRVEQIS